MRRLQRNLLALSKAFWQFDDSHPGLGLWLYTGPARFAEVAVGNYSPPHQEADVQVLEDLGTAVAIVAHGDTRGFREYLDLCAAASHYLREVRQPRDFGEWTEGIQDWFLCQTEELVWMDRGLKLRGDVVFDGFVERLSIAELYAMLKRAVDGERNGNEESARRNADLWNQRPKVFEYVTPPPLASWMLCDELLASLDVPFENVRRELVPTSKGGRPENYPHLTEVIRDGLEAALRDGNEIPTPGKVRAQWRKRLGRAVKDHVGKEPSDQFIARKQRDELKNLPPLHSPPAG